MLEINFYLPVETVKDEWQIHELSEKLAREELEGHPFSYCEGTHVYIVLDPLMDTIATILCTPVTYIPSPKSFGPNPKKNKLHFRCLGKRFPSEANDAAIDFAMELLRDMVTE